MSLDSDYKLECCFGPIADPMSPRWQSLSTSENCWTLMSTSGSFVRNPSESQWCYTRNYGLVSVLCSNRWPYWLSVATLCSTFAFCSHSTISYNSYATLRCLTDSFAQYWHPICWSGAYRCWDSRVCDSCGRAHSNWLSALMIAIRIYQSSALSETYYSEKWTKMVYQLSVRTDSEYHRYKWPYSYGRQLPAHRFSLCFAVPAKYSILKRLRCQRWRWQRGPLREFLRVWQS